MRCDEAIVRLDAYLAGELQPPVLAEISLHVEGCAACGQAVARARRLASFLAEAPCPAVPGRFAERVLARVESRREDETVAWSLWTWWSALSAPMRASAAAMLFAGAIVGMALGWSAAPVPRVTTLAFAQPADNLFAGYELDTLDDAPAGSLAGSYLALLAGREGR